MDRSRLVDEADPARSDARGRGDVSVMENESRPRPTCVGRRWPFVVRAVAFIALLAAPRLARTCDLCAIYTTTEGREAQTGIRLGIGQQYTDFGTLKLNGETKGNDTLGDVEETDTAITALYLGPAFHFTWGTRLAADIGADLPVLQHNTGLQAVADYRLRGGITWRF